MSYMLNKIRRSYLTYWLQKRVKGSEALSAWIDHQQLLLLAAAAAASYCCGVLLAWMACRRLHHLDDALMTIQSMTTTDWPCEGGTFRLFLSNRRAPRAKDPAGCAVRVSNVNNILNHMYRFPFPINI